MRTVVLYLAGVMHGMTVGVLLTMWGLKRQGKWPL